MREQLRSAADRVTEDEQRITTEADGSISTGRWTWEWIRSVLIAFGLFLVIRTFLVEAFRIPTGSMENTLLVGDFLLVNKAVFGATVPRTSARLPAFAEPGRGDIVVFVPPHEAGKNYVKRLVGMPGDTLTMVGKTLYLNGRPQDEVYVQHSDPHDIVAAGMTWQCAFAGVHPSREACRPTRDNWGPIVVPSDSFFVLGDNRDDSEDSRYWGFVPRSALRGRPLFIYYSYDTGSPGPLPLLSGVRRERLGRSVH
jgi:signal peptidase I